MITITKNTYTDDFEIIKTYLIEMGRTTHRCGVMYELEPYRNIPDKYIYEKEREVLSDILAMFVEEKYISAILDSIKPLMIEKIDDDFTFRMPNPERGDYHEKPIPSINLSSPVYRLRGKQFD